MRRRREPSIEAAVGGAVVGFAALVASAVALVVRKLIR